MSNNSVSKDEVRSSLPPSGLTSKQFGKVAEQVRRSKYYAASRQIYVDPAPELLQVRINALIDQKELILPSGGLKLGFFLLKPNTIPFNKLAHALTFNGMGEFGEKLLSENLDSLDIDLSIVSCWAVDGFGGRIGDGLGFADIALALLEEYGALKNTSTIFGAVPESRIFSESLPADPWDLVLDGYVTQSDTQYFSAVRKPSPIIWSALPKKRIRKIQPLWDLYCKKNPLE